MLDKHTLIKVRNRDNGIVGYTIPELGNLHREFQRGEVKELEMDEIRKLYWTAGGAAMLKDFLVIENAEAVKELLGEVEPEYNYTEEDIKNLLLNGSLDAFLDCLDYAPEGVLGLIKDLAVKLEVSDINKRQAILEKTGFSVDNAIRINKESQEDEETQEAPKGRRVAINTDKKEETSTARRTSAPLPKYNVVTENK